MALLFMWDNAHLKWPFRSPRTLLFLSLALAPALAHADSMDFARVFESAKSRAESVAIREASHRQADEQVSILEGALFPTINLVGSYTRQDDPNAGSGTFSNFSNADQYSARLALTQPIFQGLREFAELKASKLNRKAEELRKENEILLLYRQVAEAYYGVLSAEKDVSNLKGLIDLTQLRVKELEGRTRIGRSRRGELLSAQAQVASLKAQEEIAAAGLEQSRNQFALTTGLPRNTLLVEAKEIPAEKTKPLEEYLGAIHKRPDLMAQSALVDASEERIDSAWGAHLPTLSATGNYYLTRTGVLKDTKWDVGLQLTVPIFAGGSIQARVRELTEQQKQQKLALEQTRRAAEKQIRDAHEYLGRVFSQHARLEEAVKIAEDNYKEQTKDYRLGLVTNLDVLQALNTFQENKRLLDRSVMEIFIARVSLESATGVHP